MGTQRQEAEEGVRAFPIFQCFRPCNLFRHGELEGSGRAPLEPEWTSAAKLHESTEDYGAQRSEHDPTRRRTVGAFAAGKSPMAS
jgi:hypothetical protein